MDEGTVERANACLCGMKVGDRFHREGCAMNGKPEEFSDAWASAMLESIAESIESGGTL